MAKGAERAVITLAVVQQWGQVKELLNAGVTVDQLDRIGNGGRTVLMHAIMAQQTEIALQIIDMLPDELLSRQSACRYSRVTAASLAVKRPNMEVLEVLSRRDVGTMRRLLCGALDTPEPKTVELILGLAPQAASAVTEDGKTTESPLHWMAARPYLRKRCLFTLLKHVPASDLCLRDEEGRTPLVCAAAAGHAAAVIALMDRLEEEAIERKDDPSYGTALRSFISSFGATPSFEVSVVAKRHQKSELERKALSMLLEATEQELLENLDGRGHTVLHLAVSARLEAPLVAEILPYVTELRWRTYPGGDRTALDVAKKNHMPEVVSMLEHKAKKA